MFDTLGRLAADEPVAATELTPAVPIRRSVTDDHIVCLEDGKKLKMLKRHLMTDHGLTPEQYRARWGLRPDYPMVAPNYSAQRQALAKQIGLGRKPGQMIGKSPWLQSVFVETDAKIGDMVDVRLTAALPNSLAGELLARNSKQAA